MRPPKVYSGSMIVLPNCFEGMQSSRFLTDCCPISEEFCLLVELDSEKSLFLRGIPELAMVDATLESHPVRSDRLKAVSESFWRDMVRRVCVRVHLQSYIFLLMAGT